jgi:murein DD-endopeptidase MepM/ murein hydrolase activator NlpD
VKTRPAFVYAAAAAFVLAAVVWWFWLEETPPAVTLVGAEAGQVFVPPGSIRVSAKDARLGIREVLAVVDDELMVVDRDGDDWSVLLPERLGDGPHELTVIARDRSWNQNEGRARLAFFTDRSPPRFRLAPSTRAAQGRVLPVVLGADELAVDVSATAFGRPLPLEQRDGLWIGVTGVGVEEADGELVIEAADAHGNRGETRIPLPVASTVFPDGGVVTLDAQRQKNQRDDDLRAEDSSKRDAAYAVEQATWAISGAALLPIDGVVSSAFGKVRRYNTGVVRHHLGTDIAAAQGTPVKAAAAGVVSLAEALPIHGNAVILRHGPSLSTSYNHLQTIDVAVGDTVQRGQVVGTVGSTGQSTGPHLHWGMVAGGVAVAAETWLDRDLLAPDPADVAALEAPWPAP